VLCNRKLDRIDEVVLYPLAKMEEVFMRRMGLASVVERLVSGGSNEDVTARKTQEVWAIATVVEVQGHGTLGVGWSHGRDADPKGRSWGLMTSTGGYQ